MLLERQRRTNFYHGLLSPMIARESARPYFAYSAFYPVDRAYTRMFAELKPHEILVPSPLLMYRSPEILLHFQFDPSGRLTSPQVPAGNQRDLAETGYATHDSIDAAAGLMARLKAVLKRKKLLAILPGDDVVFPAPAATQPFDGGRRESARDRIAQQARLNTGEWQARNAAARQARAADARAVGSWRRLPEVRKNAFCSVWIDGELLLARRVRVNGNDYVQGCWLNWQHIRNWLLRDAEDLLLQADLSPVENPTNEGQPYMLAALPLKLLPCEVRSDIPADAWPISLSLLIAWGCILIGAVAVALLLSGTVRLSERRGSFVSAVTHELRTPLTTFRLYADMLAQGMVTDEKQRREYLDRLCQESERLSHLVANVLAYARLSGPRSGKDLETVTLGDLVERSRDRLTVRAEQAGMTLAVAAAEGPAQARVQANVSAVEQIVLNLVDNACKYAARSGERTIHLELDWRDRFGLIRVRDHGPGIAAGAAKRLFRPFHKPAREAAGSAPGVGLGLALSRRLARDMNGELRLDRDVTDGACFELSLRAETDL